MVVDRLGDPSGESEFIAKILEKDEKNYHVWSYRQWLVKRFALWADQYGELAFVEKLLDNDVRNNSAWSHRWFFVMGQLKDGEAVSREIVDREIAFTEEAVLVAPMNPSPWNYLRGYVFLISLLPCPLICILIDKNKDYYAAQIFR
jgi:protein farnesyltransferase/geranylgeranyltransferase type-1 subunit alpha